MKKLRDWSFVALLIALAAAGGWLKEQQSTEFADADVVSNQG